MRLILVAAAAVAVTVATGGALAQPVQTSYGTGRMGFVELIAGEAIPVASETHSAQLKVSPKIGARGGYLFAWSQKKSPHPWVLGFEAGIDWTRFTLDRTVVPEPAESSRVRVLAGLRAGSWQSRRTLLYVRAALALDMVELDFKGSNGCGAFSSTALGGEMGFGLAVLFGRLAVGVQANAVAAFHRDEAMCVDLSYDSFDLDLILTLGARI